MENQFVVFDVANEHYGVDIAAVESIIKIQAITAVPGAPNFVEGVTNLRGTVLPVIDLRKRFKLPRQETHKNNRIVVVDMSGAKVGMVVDAVSEVLRVPAEAVEPPSPLVSTTDTAFIRGIAKVDDRLVILVDLAKVLSKDEQSSVTSLPLAA